MSVTLLALLDVPKLVSAIAMMLLYNPAAEPSRVYYGTDTRVFSLLLGAWMAFIPDRDLAPTTGGRRDTRCGRVRRARRGGRRRDRRRDRLRRGVRGGTRRGVAPLGLLRRLHGGHGGQTDGRQTVKLDYRGALRDALRHALANDERCFLMGEDVGS